MIERTIVIENADPRDIYGSNNKYLDLIKAHFPELKIIGRGLNLKVNGESDRIDHFESKIEEIILHLNKYNSLSINQLERILKDEMPVADDSNNEDDTILYSTTGSPIKARTLNQRAMVRAMKDNDMLFAIGPAGTGKTYTAVALAVRALKTKQIKKIILTRPAVEAGENLGFLPGDLKEKLDPYMQPLYDALRDMIPPEKLAYYLETGTIQIAPLAFMRGRTLDRAFVILDEAQNTTHSQMKMFLTRMGSDAQFIITGDAGQIDLPRKQASGLKEAMGRLQNIKGIKFVMLDDRDVIRHDLVKHIIRAYQDEE
ncbi:PhoH family protein [Owenweeksia hongkongensis]|uniref:PhoH-like protein n=1 Tax=Owenweeksia hongkongensis (strain DSM 17368 / CIP 108786 / JCM 12287 / NRRL B-23963 / UST20020801) TaxID=926562 RepID=G8QZF1_OWEHD|nr:PhoH family protein [Owenweeksia hongkongensis]AEV32579.1 phosphate starvation-inducible protein PhoH, predicted ATPase [Owenweeksia hongkongensis DSM 17368]